MLPTAYLQYIYIIDTNHQTQILLYLNKLVGKSIYNLSYILIFIIKDEVFMSLKPYI